MITPGSHIEKSQPHRTMSMVTTIQQSPSQDHVLDYILPTQGAALGEASSTEGTPSTQSTARRFGQNQTPAHSGRLSPFGGTSGDSIIGRKRAATSALERELKQPVFSQHKAVRTVLDENMRKSTKVSAANSPWILRSTDRL